MAITIAIVNRKGAARGAGAGAGEGGGVTVREFIQRAEDGSRCKQSQVWLGDQFEDLLRWLRLAEVLLVDVAAGDGESVDCKITAKELLREMGHG